MNEETVTPSGSKAAPAGLCKPKPESASASRSRSQRSKDDRSQAARVALSGSQSRDFLVGSLVCWSRKSFPSFCPGALRNPSAWHGPSQTDDRSNRSAREAVTMSLFIFPGRRRSRACPWSGHCTDPWKGHRQGSGICKRGKGGPE